MKEISTLVKQVIWAIVNVGILVVVLLTVDQAVAQIGNSDPIFNVIIERN